jgi:hypothetical protein
MMAVSLGDTTQHFPNPSEACAEGYRSLQLVSLAIFGEKRGTAWNDWQVQGS